MTKTIQPDELIKSLADLLPGVTFSDPDAEQFVGYSGGIVPVVSFNGKLYVVVFMKDTDYPFARWQLTSPIGYPEELSKILGTAARETGEELMRFAFGGGRELVRWIWKRNKQIAVPIIFPGYEDLYDKIKHWRTEALSLPLFAHDKSRYSSMFDTDSRFRRKITLSEPDDDRVFSYAIPLGYVSNDTNRNQENGKMWKDLVVLAYMGDAPAFLDTETFKDHWLNRAVFLIPLEEIRAENFGKPLKDIGAYMLVWRKGGMTPEYVPVSHAMRFHSARDAFYRLYEAPGIRRISDIPAIFHPILLRATDPEEMETIMNSGLYIPALTAPANGEMLKEYRRSIAELKDYLSRIDGRQAGAYNTNEREERERQLMEYVGSQIRTAIEYSRNNGVNVFVFNPHMAMLTAYLSTHGIKIWPE